MDTSRRRFLAGGLSVLGVLGAAAGGRTAARLADDASASGSVRVDGDPTLNYQITDESMNTNAKYTISYKVEWVSDFDRIEVTVDNIPDGQYNPNPGGGDEAESFNSTSVEGSFSTKQYGGHGNETFEFIFEVYKQGQSSPVLRQVVTDQADGSNSGEGDFSDPNDPRLESLTLTDTTKNTNTDYTLAYEVSNLSDFKEVVVTFDYKPSDQWGDKTRSSSSSPTGSVSYHKGGTGGAEFDIIVEVKDTSGLTVDSHTLTDVADGSGTQWSR